MAAPPSPPDSLPGTGGGDPFADGDVFTSRAFLVTKHSWKGKYRRIFVVGAVGVATLNPTSMEATNRWAWSDVVSVAPTGPPVPHAHGPTVVTAAPGAVPAPPPQLEFTLTYRKKGGGKKTDNMRFSSEHRALVLTEMLRHHERFAERILPQAAARQFFAYKVGWAENRVSVLLQPAPHGLTMQDPASRRLLAVYPYKDMSRMHEVEDYPGGFVLEDGALGRLRLFASESRAEILSAVSEFAGRFVGVALAAAAAPFKFDAFAALRFGRFGDDVSQTSVSEFAVYKQSGRHADGPVRRLLCLTETCILERDPATYGVVSLRPLATVAALVRHAENTQLFSLQYTGGESRSYTSTDRDSLLASFLDGVRGSGNRDVHVRARFLELGRRLCPLDCSADEEVEASHLKFLATPPPGWTFAEAVARFNANVSYSGLAHAVTQDHLFAQNKEKLIHAALLAILNRDVAELERMAVEDMEQQFHALRRLVASKAGFSAFTALPGFREKIGVRVARALKLGHDGISHAAIDMVCTLMEPMHDNFDLRQEQLNKSSLLSSERFLEGLLDMWTLHVNRGTGTLVVAAMLDFLTFALCAPYSETTDGKQFDVLLEKVADRGRTLYRLFQQPSHTIVKGAGLLMKALIEEGSEEVGMRMQMLALAEGAVPVHLRTALFTDTKDHGQLLVSRQLSRHLIGLWTANNASSDELLKRVFPAGLLLYLTSDDATPTSEVDRLHVRDNLNMAIKDAESNRGNALLRVAGRGLRQGKEMASKTAEVLGEKTHKYTEEAWKASEKYMELAMQHWRQKMGSEWPVGRGGGAVNGGPVSSADKFTARPQERPIVLRKRRQRMKSDHNWPLFYYMFERDHERPNLLWNLKTRQELRECLEAEIRSFIQDRELAGTAAISWNHAEFIVTYASIADEIKIGDYFLRILLEEDRLATASGNQQGENEDSSPIIVGHNPAEFFNDLYHRFLLTPKTEMKCLCLQAMTVVYGRHHTEIGAFNDTKYIVAMLDRTVDRSERDRLLLFLAKLVLNRENARTLVMHASGIRTLLDLLPLAHLHAKRRVVSEQGSAIETSAEAGEGGEAREKEWYHTSADTGPVSFKELCKLFEEKQVSAKTKVWAQGMEGWRLLQQVSQLKWTLLAKGQAVMNESEMSALILDILISVCRFYPSRDPDGAIIRPLPKIKQSLSDPHHSLPHLVQLLLTFEPVLVEKTATLLHLVLEDNPRLPSLYLTGFFFFVLMYMGSNVLPIARFLAEAHAKQAFRSEDKENPTGGHSILAQMLPEAMVAFLTNHGPEKFAEIYLGEFDTPEAIWNTEMRKFMIQKIAYHLADYTPRLKSNVRALYQYCPIPRVSYPVLETELFCDIYYLRNLCDDTKFPEWPILDPVNLLREVLGAWQHEVEKKPGSMTARDAMAVLGLQVGGDEPDEASVRKAYFRMAQKYHPDKNPAGREMFEKVNAAYEFLSARRAGSKVPSDQPNPENIVLILRSQSILFCRYSETLHPYKYAGYPMLIKTIRLETADEKLFSKSAPLLAAASECAYYTVKCSALNAEELRRENGLEVLYQAFERCVSVLSQSSKPDDVAVQVCTHVIRFYTVAARFEGCREKMVEMQELVKNICRVFYYKQLTTLSAVACECVSSLSADHILQMHFLQAGALWHLLLFLFDYDVTLAEGGVAHSEATSRKAVSNRLARLALVAAARMAGLHEAVEVTEAADDEAESMSGLPPGMQLAPKNPVIEESLTAMLTPHIVHKMRSNEVDEALKLLNTDSENPYLVWDLAQGRS